MPKKFESELNTASLMKFFDCYVLEQVQDFSRIVGWSDDISGMPNSAQVQSVCCTEIFATQEMLNMLITQKVNNKICPSFCGGVWKQEDMHGLIDPWVFHPASKNQLFMGSESQGSTWTSIFN